MTDPVDSFDKFLLRVNVDKLEVEYAGCGSHQLEATITVEAGELRSALANAEVRPHLGQGTDHKAPHALADVRVLTGLLSDWVKAEASNIGEVSGDFADDYRQLIGRAEKWWLALGLAWELGEAELHSLIPEEVLEFATQTDEGDG